MAAILSFRDLDVYKLAREQARRIFIITKLFPKEEKYSLIDQIRRSSRAVDALYTKLKGGKCLIHIGREGLPYAFYVLYAELILTYS